MLQVYCWRKCIVPGSVITVWIVKERVLWFDLFRSRQSQCQIFEKQAARRLRTADRTEIEPVSSSRWM